MKLKEVCEINPRTQGIDDSTAVSFIPMPSVSEDGKIDTSDIRSYQEVKKGYTVFQENDVLFAKITPCMENGKGAIAHGLMNGVGCGSSEFHVLRANSEMVCPEWIYYLTAWKQFRTEAEKHMTGSAGQQRVPKVYLENYDINIPSLAEQTRETKLLSQLQQVIDYRKKELQKLDELIKARFVEMFGDPNTNTKNWPMGKISDIGKCVAGATPSTAKKEYWENGTIPWLSSGEVNKGRVYETDAKITQLGYENASTKMVPAKTVILAMAGQGKTRGTAAITEIELCTNQSICSIVNNEKVNAEYLLNFLKLQYKELRNASTSSEGRGGLNLKIIGDYPIMIPPIELQNDYETFCKQLDKSKVVVQKALDESQLLFDSLMQKYFG